MYNNFIVALVDGNGKIISSQPYEEYQYGRRSMDIIVPVRGGRLIEILHDDIGNISYENNRLVLKHIFVSNINVTAMTLLGKIAEAVLVKRCHKNEDLNRKLFALARRKRATKKTSHRFHAIGTGLKPTLQRYPHRYNPSDPQRDIIWVAENGHTALMAGSTSMYGVEAGLQVKASLDGISYVVNDLETNRYEVPMVYFPINNDFEKVVDKLIRDKKTFVLNPNTGEYRNIIIGDDIVDIRTYDHDAFEEVKDYYPIVVALLKGDIEIADLIESARGNGTLQNIVLSTAISVSNADSIILT